MAPKLAIAGGHAPTIPVVAPPIAHDRVGTKPRSRVARPWLLVALAAVLLLKYGEMSARQSGYSWGLLEQLSMYPRVKDLDFWVAKAGVEFSRGDLAVFTCEDDRLIKEVIALQGDRVQVATARDRGLPLTTIKINGVALSRKPFLWLSMTGEVRPGQTFIVPRGKMVVAAVNMIAAEQRLYIVDTATAMRVAYNVSILPEGVVTWWRCRQGSSPQYISFAMGKEE